MGLAPYGSPIYVQRILDTLLDLKEDGSFRLNMKYFGYLDGLRMTNTQFDQFFGGPPRKPESEITQREMDIAASIVVQKSPQIAQHHFCKIVGRSNRSSC
jgi:carbamoyltransferase